VLADVGMAILPEGGTTEVKIAIFTAVGDEKQVTIGLECHPLNIDVFKTAVPFVLLVRFALN
jgi:hypothetical protein